VSPKKTKLTNGNQLSSIASSTEQAIVFLGKTLTFHQANQLRVIANQLHRINRAKVIEAKHPSTSHDRNFSD